MRCLEPRGNGLVGPIPRSLGRLEQLFILTLAGNSLSRRIPAEIGQLRRLRDLYLDDNELSGPLPAAMGGMAGLRSLGVSGNDLSGPVPETFAPGSPSTGSTSHGRTCASHAGSGRGTGPSRRRKTIRSGASR